MSSALADLLIDTVPAARLPDARWLRAYLHDGCPHGEPILLSIGESWQGPPESLLTYWREAPAYAHGYQLSPYGLPFLRSVLVPLIMQSHRLTEMAGCIPSFDIAVTWTGTRSTIFDFGRLLVASTTKRHSVVAVAPSPGWDYRGVLSAAGLSVASFHLDAEEQFSPSPAAATGRLDALWREHNGIDLLVINAQHNPTGVNWSSELVSTLIDYAIEHRIAVLLDDALYAIHRPDLQPTSALAILLHRLCGLPASAAPRWLAVRSLGKQFACNGWALGAVVGPPDLLDDLVGRVRAEHVYNYAGAAQYAMARWLSTDECIAFTKARNEVVTVQAASARRRLLQFGAPPDAINEWQCGLFLLVKVPPGFNVPGGSEAFIAQCFRRTGVLFSPANGGPTVDGHTYAAPYVRVFLGGSEAQLEAAFDRLQLAGLDWMARPDVQFAHDRQ